MNGPVSIYEDPQAAAEMVELEIEPRTFVQVDYGAPEFEARLTERGEPAVFHRGVYMLPEVADRLLVQFRKSAAVGDWWSPDALRLSDQLQRAIEARNALV